MTDAAATPPEATPITVQTIEAKLAAGAPIDAAEVRWLLDALRTTTASADVATELEAPSGGDSRPTREELITEFRLGPDPSPDMLAYLADYVMERDAEAAAEAAESAADS